jgi:excisionase family DNA binding protein
VTDRLLTAEEVAEILNVKPRWVRYHTDQDNIPHFKLGRYHRYRLERVLAWLEEQERGGGATRLRKAS